MLSKPLICCSSGVATDCSIVTASAPVKVVLTMIWGGTMSGNWATGNPAIATSPPMTVTMAITIATIGRLMKSFEIIVFSSPQARQSLVCLCVRLRVYYRSRLDLLCSFHDNELAGFQSIFDNPLCPAALANFDRAHFNLVSAAYYGDLITALQFTDGALWNKQSVALRRRYRTDATELSRPQHVSRIKEYSSHADCACLWINLAVRKEEASLFRIGASIGEDQFELDLDNAGAAPRFNEIALGKVKVLLLAESEIDFYRINGSNSR